MCLSTSFSKHFVIIGVSATGRKSLREVVSDFLGTGMMVADFRQAGMLSCSRERLKMLVKTGASWSAHALSTFPGTPFGPVAFLGLTARSTRLTSSTCTVSGVVSVGVDCGGGWGGVTKFWAWDSKRAKKLFSSSASAMQV